MGTSTVNMLGATPKEQWLTAINIYEMCVTENIRWVRDELADVEDEDNVKKLDIALRSIKDFASEMRRLGEMVLND